MNKWLPEIDILKATAILLIVFVISDNYVSCYSINQNGSIFYGSIYRIKFFFLLLQDFYSHGHESLKNFHIFHSLPFYLKNLSGLSPLRDLLASLVIVFEYQCNAGNVTAL